jgi:hypothetical protein
MTQYSFSWRRAVALASLGGVCLLMRADPAAFVPRGLSARMRALPRQTLWAWERAEDLRTVPPETTAIAWLDQTIAVGTEVVSTPRRQPLTYRTGATRIAVVRVEVAPGATLDEVQQKRAVEQLLRSADRPDTAALQVDFDATRSQRGFYRRGVGGFAATDAGGDTALDDGAGELVQLRRLDWQAAGG